MPPSLSRNDSVSKRTPERCGKKGEKDQKEEIRTVTIKEERRIYLEKYKGERSIIRTRKQYSARKASSRSSISVLRMYRDGLTNLKS